MSAVAQRYFARERGEGRMVGEMVDERRVVDVVVCVKHAVTVRVWAEPGDDPEAIAQEHVKGRAPLLANKGGSVEELDIAVHKVTPR